MPGPSDAITWRSPSLDLIEGTTVSAPARIMIRLWIVGTVLLVGIWAWDALHLEQVSATVTDNSLAGDGGRECDLTWLAGDVLVEYDDLSCSMADEEGSQMALWVSSLWGDPSQYLAETAIWGLLWPLLLSAHLGGLCGVLSFAFESGPLLNARDRRQIRRHMASERTSTKLNS